MPNSSLPCLGVSFTSWRPHPEQFDHLMMATIICVVITGGGFMFLVIGAFTIFKLPVAPVKPYMSNYQKQILEEQ